MSQLLRDIPNVEAALIRPAQKLRLRVRCLEPIGSHAASVVGSASSRTLPMNPRTGRTDK